MTIKGVIGEGGAERGYKGQTTGLTIPHKLTGGAEPVPNYLQQILRKISLLAFLGVFGFVCLTSMIVMTTFSTELKYVS